MKVSIKETYLGGFTSLLLPFACNYALDLVQKVTNEIWLESSHTCHALDSSTEISNLNPTCCTHPNTPLYQLTPFMCLRVWFIPLCLTAPMIPQPYGVWFSSSKCRRTSSQREGWVLALRAGEAEIKDAWSSTHPPLKIISTVPYSLLKIFLRQELNSKYMQMFSTHPTKSHTQAATERIVGAH